MATAIVAIPAAGRIHLRLCIHVVGDVVPESIASVGCVLLPLDMAGVPENIKTIRYNILRTASKILKQGKIN